MNDMTVAQPINGSRGATVAGPRNIPLEAQVPDIFAAPLSDHGSIRIFVVRCGLPCDPAVGGHSLQ
jgi:hypothetical protein